VLGTRRATRREDAARRWPLGVRRRQELMKRVESELVSLRISWLSVGRS